MSPLERDSLNPCEKWRLKGRFPWKMLIHISLALLSTALVCLWIGNESLHARHTLQLFHQQLLGVPGGSSEERVISLGSVELFRKQLELTVDGYWNLNKTAMCPYQHSSSVLTVSFTGVDGNTETVLLDDEWRDDLEYLDRISEEAIINVAKVWRKFPVISL